MEGCTKKVKQIEVFQGSNNPSPDFINIRRMTSGFSKMERGFLKLP